MNGSTGSPTVPGNVPDFEDAATVLMAIRGLSDLLCNTQLQSSMNMVKPENMEALVSILADRLEHALAQ